MNNHTIKRPNATFITNGAGFVELMNSSEMQNILRDEATRRANSLNDGEKTYRVDVTPGNTKSVAFVATDSFEARLSNSQNNDLLKVLK